MNAVRLKYCTVEQDADGTVWTCFPDGTSVPATSHDTHHYHVIAHRCGYQDDVAGYTYEHEFAHSFVAQELHNAPSAVLLAIAQGRMLRGREAAYEEIAAQTFQRWLRANERPILAGVDWDRMKRDALALLDAR